MEWNQEGQLFLLPLGGDPAAKCVFLYLLSKDVPAVVDQNPSHPPAGDQPSLGKASTGQDRDISAKLCKGLIFAVFKHLNVEELEESRLVAGQDSENGVPYSVSDTKAGLSSRLPSAIVMLFEPPSSPPPLPHHLSIPLYRQTVLLTHHFCIDLISQNGDTLPRGHWATEGRKEDIQRVTGCPQLGWTP